MTVRARMRRIEDAVAPQAPLEPVSRSVEVGGPTEPRRRAEWTAGTGLLLFFVLLVLVRLRWAPALTVDTWTSEHVHAFDLAHAWAVSTSIAASALGITAVRWALIGVLSVVLLVARRPRAAVFVVCVELIASGLAVGAQDVVARHRPALVDPVAVATGPSFPSSHAMGAAATYSLVVSAILYSGLVPPSRWRAVLVVVVAAIPVAVGVSRVVLGVHFVTDVLAGWAAGVACVAIATALVRPWRRDPAAQTSVTVEAAP